MSQTEQNKSTALAFLDLAFNRRQPRDAAAQYLGSNYRQHNPMAADGAEPFIGFAMGLTGQNPDLRMVFKRQIADGDLVMVHSHATLSNGARGTAVVDIFRFENGKIVEHWDVLQDVPETAQNQNTMF